MGGTASWAAATRPEPRNPPPVRTGACNDRALELAQKAYALDRERGDTVQFARRLSQVGDVYASMRRYREAEESYHESIRWLRTKNSLNSICINHKQLGNLYRSQGRTREAIASYEQSATLARSIRNNYILQQCVERLSELYEMTDPARALRNLRESAELKDITYNERTNSLLSSYAIHFETSQKTSTILAQQEELRTRHMVNIVSVAFALLALVALVAIVCVIRLRTRNRRLEREMERTRQDFYTNIAHEFRTPLTVILGQAQSLGDTEKSPAQRKRIQSIASQGQVLLNLVDQLLDISQIRPVLGNEAWRTGDIVPRVRMLVESFCVEAQQSLINVEFQPQHPSIVMDFIPEYLRKSLASLVSNAIKFTPRGGRIIITISQKSGSVVFAIADNGAGIPAEDMPHIFEAFYQGHAPKATLGTGIGLYIVRQMTQAMYGTVEVSSIEGRGSCFTLTLPQHQPGKVFAMLEDKDYQPVPKEAKPASGTPDDTPDDTDGSGATQPEGQGDTSILVVDDNTEVARYIGAIFSEDHQLIYASDGEEGACQGHGVPARPHRHRPHDAADERRGAVQANPRRTGHEPHPRRHSQRAQPGQRPRGVHAGRGGRLPREAVQRRRAAGKRGAAARPTRTAPREILQSHGGGRREEHGGRRQGQPGFRRASQPNHQQERHQHLALVAPHRRAHLPKPAAAQPEGEERHRRGHRHLHPQLPPANGQAAAFRQRREHHERLLAVRLRQPQLFLAAVQAGSGLHAHRLPAAQRQELGSGRAAHPSRGKTRAAHTAASARRGYRARASTRAAGSPVLRLFPLILFPPQSFRPSGTRPFRPPVRTEKTLRTGRRNVRRENIFCLRTKYISSAECRDFLCGRFQKAPRHGGKHGKRRENPFNASCPDGSNPIIPVKAYSPDNTRIACQKCPMQNILCPKNERMLSGQVVTLRHRKRKGGGKSQHHERQDRRAWTTRKHNGASTTSGTRWRCKSSGKARRCMRGTTARARRRDGGCGGA